MTEREKMLAGKLYIAADAELAALHSKAQRLVRRYNETAPGDEESRRTVLEELFGAIGGNCHIEPTFRCDYGGNISIGDNFYANFDCIILDVCPVVIGNNVMFGPRVCVYTAGHPVDHGVRATQLEFGKPVAIGHDVWIGGNAIILPGVDIGDRAVVGAGSVVTRDIPPDTLAAGNPCRVLRAIGSRDRETWRALQAEYENTP